MVFVLRSCPARVTMSCFDRSGKRERSHIALCKNPVMHEERTIHITLMMQHSAEWVLSSSRSPAHVVGSRDGNLFVS